MTKPQVTSKEAYTSFTDTVNALSSLRHEDNLRVDSSDIGTRDSRVAVNADYSDLAKTEEA